MGYAVGSADGYGVGCRALLGSCVGTLVGASVAFDGGCVGAPVRINGTFIGVDDGVGATLGSTVGWYVG